MHTAGIVVAARTPGGLDLYRRTFRRLRELGYEGGAIDELDGASAAALEPALDGDQRRRGPARARRPVRPPGGADGRARGAAAGRRRRDPRGLRAARARAAARRLGAGYAGRRGDGAAGRDRRRAADRAAAAPARRARAADGRARPQRHDRRPRHAAAPRALPGRGEAGPEPVRRRRARSPASSSWARARRTSPPAPASGCSPRRARTWRAGGRTPTARSRPGPACGRRRRTGCR